ncbi:MULTISPECIES: hypothetical protein [Syntrophotalea]|jgi:hypothetical protein|uniref:Uncharacterized protein n=1 Tax=Syntrophotalea acetylenica TaxID=29542 RepID=A0A1L3GGZ5_SYNAC|nr:hypothetical protein [Syntrophotalea acetylenica]APG25212.1 hypothetical protein A7E75_09390 [Syntrophotalea acetylenica]APG43281.1 hypothetical protein A6070_03365 [Syntrophotalea acetylenica]MDY0261486.1 hypothetical protein [Syntrophotalea acetylenica]
MWLINTQGEREFRHGHEAYGLAAATARACVRFCADVEDEWTADEERSCYNCRLRRWTRASFLCLAPAS